MDPNYEEGPASQGTIRVQRQGKAVVERDGHSYLVMFPDGTCLSFDTKPRAEAAIKQWFKQNLRELHIGLGEIEWRS